MINGDMLLLREDITRVLQSKSPAIGICTVGDPRKYGIVTVENIEKDDDTGVEDLVITSFEEKSEKPLSSLINCGIYFFDTEIFEHLGKVTSSPRGELELVDALMPLIQARVLRAVETPSWVDLGSPWDLLDVNMNLLHAHSSHIAPDVVIEDGVYLHGNVSIGSGTIIKSGTYIEGPCIIGNNSRIGPHVYIRGTTAIGDNCHIGHSTEVKNSIIFSGSNLPHFNYIGDTIVGSGCNFGAGTKVANLRHDKAVIKVGGISTGRKKFGAVIGDNVLFGINCAVNVGSRIGNHCSFAPGARIHGDIFDETVYRE
jgi:bifunctional UDP-N-acetylglucosamine pyrophosphorylase/glucosamine-1-phosphate N-acetyltransferase